MEILFISDYVCPYCLVAKEALRRAMALTGINATVTWQPYELTRAPEPGVDTYSDPVRRQRYKVLDAPCRELELDMKLPPKVIPRPYSTLAFRGWHYACDHGAGETYNDLVYRAYFIEERDIGDPAVLADLAERSGLPREEFLAALHDETYACRQDEAADYAKTVLKPGSVPTICIDGVKQELKTYTTAEMVAILRGAAGQEP